MKRYLLLAFIVALTVIIYNCDDAGITTEEEKTHEISGTINNWSLGTKILKAVVKDSTNANIFLSDSTTIANDGSFTLHLKTPPDNFFWVYSVIAGANCNGTIIISPAGLKQAAVTFSIYDETNNPVGTIQKKSYDFIITPGSHSVSYLNFKENGNVNGSTTCIGTMDTSKVTADNYNCTSGWNSLVLVWNQFSPPTHYDATIQNSEPAASLWYYVP